MLVRAADVESYSARDSAMVRSRARREERLYLVLKPDLAVWKQQNYSS